MTSEPVIHYYIKDKHIKMMLTSLLQNNKYVSNALPQHELLHHWKVKPSDVVVLETAGDVAELSQFVYKLYQISEESETLPIIALLPQKAIDSNVRVATWHIKGFAALMALIATESDWLEYVTDLVSRVTKT